MTSTPITKRLPRFCLVLILSGVPGLHLSAQQIIEAGARSLGLSHASVSFSDEWSAFHNQAGLAGVKNISSGIFYESKFGIEELSLVAGTAIIPTTPGVLGASFSQFGKGAFKEHLFGIAFARKLSTRWSAGIQLDYLIRRFPENSHARGGATFEGGFLFMPTEKLTLGAHVFNPVKSSIHWPSGAEKMPVVFRAGAHYCFDENVLLAVETEKSNQTPTRFKSGIEFSPAANMALRLGVSGKPFKTTAGFGFKARKFISNIGFSYHGNLGITPSVSFLFHW